MQDMELDRVFAGLRRFPDVEAPNLFAHDASDRLLLETAAEHARAGMRVPSSGTGTAP